MIKKLAFAALAAASVSAFSQNSTTTSTTTTTVSTTHWDQNDWAQKYDTYHIGNVDVNGLDHWSLMRIVDHELKQANATDAYRISDFVQYLPPDQAHAVLKALVNNYKEASAVRDEVAMARYGTAQDYAWLSYPPLTWSDTPGQSSWSNLAMTPTTTTMTPNMSNNGDMIAMSDDSSRPMRMIMARHAAHDIDYDRALDILRAGLNPTERGALNETFHPQPFDPTSYTNATELDAIIHVVENNAKMVDGLGRWAWYNHYDANYYNTHRWDW